jgi:adenylate kinase family enzyme
MHNFIFILGAQGAGKTTVARLLKEKLKSVYVDFDWVRDFHLDAGWTNISEVEERMSWENLLFLLKNYTKYNYKNIIVGGFTDNNIVRILSELKEYKNMVITLYVTDDEVLKQRVLNPSRDSGFRDYEKSIQLNKELKDELHFSNEYKIDNTHPNPQDTVNQIINIIVK